MDYTLGVLERLIVLGALPGTGDLLYIRIVSELQDALSFSEAELGDLQMKIVNGRTRWQQGAIPDKTVEIGPAGQQMIREGLSVMVKQLDKAEQVTVTHLKLAELFNCDLSDVEDDEDEGTTKETP